MYLKTFSCTKGSHVQYMGERHMLIVLSDTMATNGEPFHLEHQHW